MNTIELPDNQDEGEPPSVGRRVSLGRYLDRVINQNDDGLQYTDYVNPRSNCSVAVNLYDLEVVGRIGNDEPNQSLRPLTYQTVATLERSASLSMARVAAHHGFSASPDPEYDYPAFWADKGAFSLMFRQPQVRAMLIGERPSSGERLLLIRSENIQTTGELLVLLGGLAVLSSAFETKKHRSWRK
ncbi:MAG: hypothetical protein ABI716_00705 [Candidatus Saccharibacteria bacterium]